MKKSKPTSKMNYKAATTSTTGLNNSNVVHNSKFMQKNCEDYAKMKENAEFQKRAHSKMNEIVERFVNYKKQELSYENYSSEEIEAIIDELLSFDNDDYDDYSSDEDDISEYSDDDLF